VRQRDVREGRAERLVAGVDAVTETGDGRLGGTRRAHEHALEDLQRDVDDVVLQAAAVREAAEVATDGAETAEARVTGLLRRDADVEAQVLGRHGAGADRVEVEGVQVGVQHARARAAEGAAGEDVLGEAGEEGGGEVVALGRRSTQLVRVVDLVDRLDEDRDLGVLHLGEELAVRVRRGPVEEVLEVGRHDRLVDERVAQARDLHERPGLRRCVAVLVDGGGGRRVVVQQDAVLGPRRRRPDADDRVGSGVAVRDELGLGDLERHGVDVVAGQAVVAGLGQVAAVQQVEDAQVEEERVVRRTGEGLATGDRGRGDGLVAQVGVVGVDARPTFGGAALPSTTRFVACSAPRRRSGSTAGCRSA
jgi:hypothetical protein